MSWDDDDWETSANIGGGVEQESEAVETFSDEEEVVDDDDDHDVEKPKPKKATDPNKVKAKSLSKQKQKELEAEMEIAREEAKAMKPLTKEEKLAEKLRLQKLVEDSEVSQMAEMFQIKKEEGSLDVEAIQGLLQNIPLNVETDFKNLADALGRRVEVEDKPHLAKEFVKDFCRHVGRSLGGEDLAEVISILGVVKNEKVKIQLNKKKKKGGKKFANVQRDDFDMDGSTRGVGGGFSRDMDDLDGDFM